MSGGALLLYGLGRRGPIGAALSALGEALVVRGATGRPAGAPADPYRTEESVTIQRSREEVYRFFRDVTNLPRFILDLEGDAEIVEDVEGERIAWRAVDPQKAVRAGVVCFSPAPGGRGTEATMIIDAEPRERARGDMRRAKQLLEAGEIPTTAGQPCGRKGG